MKKLGRKHYYKKGTPLFEAWYANLNSMEIETVRRAKNFKTWDEPVEVFNGEIISPLDFAISGVVFNSATVALRSTAALIISMGIFLITGIGTPFLVFI